MGMIVRIEMYSPHLQRQQYLKQNMLFPSAISIITDHKNGGTITHSGPQNNLFS